MILGFLLAGILACLLHFGLSKRAHPKRSKQSILLQHRTIFGAVTAILHMSAFALSITVFGFGVGVGMYLILLSVVWTALVILYPLIFSANAR